MKFFYPGMVKLEANFCPIFCDLQQFSTEAHKLTGVLENKIVEKQNLSRINSIELLTKFKQQK